MKASRSARLLFPELICNTWPLQYLHQLGLFHILPSLADRALVPPAVAREIETGIALGVNLPDLGFRLAERTCAAVLRPAAEG